jgi:hypothetical protein
LGGSVLLQVFQEPAKSMRFGRSGPPGQQGCLGASLIRTLVLGRPARPLGERARFSGEFCSQRPRYEEGKRLPCVVVVGPPVSCISALTVGPASLDVLYCCRGALCFEHSSSSSRRSCGALIPQAETSCLCNVVTFREVVSNASASTSRSGAQSCAILRSLRAAGTLPQAACR